jgi:hypothetical protein
MMSNPTPTPSPGDRDYHVIHITQTPLVGAPGLVSEAVNRYASRYTSEWIFTEDYKGERAGMMTRYGRAMGLGTDEARQAFIDRLQVANVIQIHNALPRTAAQLIRENAPQGCKFVYQVRSPHREPPLFVDMPEVLEINFDAYTAICQYHLRVYPTYRPTPLLDLDQPSIQLLKDGEKPRILYRPSHLRPPKETRWNTKYSKLMHDSLLACHDEGLIELIYPQNPVPPHKLKELRRACHISIDEIATGAFHTVSIEGLCAGNIVINNSDLFSDMAMAYLTKDGSLPPFYRTNHYNFDARLRALIADPDAFRALQQASYDYFDHHLRAEHQVHYYTDVYDDILRPVSAHNTNGEAEASAQVMEVAS